jgi:hypothetical protein
VDNQDRQLRIPHANSRATTCDQVCATNNSPNDELLVVSVSAEMSAFYGSPKTKEFPLFLLMFYSDSSLSFRRISAYITLGCVLRFCIGHHDICGSASAKGFV